MTGNETAALKRLRSWMQANSYSQQKLADALGINQSSVSLWLRGLSRPEPHLRAVLEELTSIGAADWNTTQERSAQATAIRRIQKGAA